jgi:hypothetical protein
MSLSTIGRSALLAAVLLLSACSKKEPDRWTAAEKTVASATTAATPPVAKPETGAFNAFLPPEGTDGLKRVFVTDKPGYAEAVYGEEFLSISVTVADEAAKKKFVDAKETIKGFPVTTFGKNQTIVLAGGKYQVKAVSKRADDAERRKWLSRMDLAGIAAVPAP